MDGPNNEQARPGESQHERWDRNFRDLLQELRVAQTGVQILFAFLLTLPFSVGFRDTTSLERTVYVVTLLASASASALLMAPVSYHRMVFHQDRKHELVQTASRMAIIGMCCLLVAIMGAVFVVMDVVLNVVAACISAAAVGGLCVTLWYALPLARRRPHRQRE